MKRFGGPIIDLAVAAEGTLALEQLSKPTTFADFEKGV
jgi:hypothetical protein